MEILPGLYQLNCTNFSRVYAVVQNEGVTLIDTSFPWRSGRILRELRDYGIRPADVCRILLTHCDADHIGNAARLQRLSGCAVYIGAPDLPYALGWQHTHNLKGLFSRLFRIKCPPSTKPMPTDAVGIGDFSVYPTPGHSPGHCCFRWKNVLFLGDLVFSTRDRRKKSPGAIIVQRTKTEALLRGMDVAGIRWLCPSHAEPIHLAKPW